MQTRVFLLGIKHTGKSTVGSILAASLDVAFVDQDTLIVDAYRSMTGQAVRIREVYRAVGPERFAELERDSAAQMCRMTPPLVGACGGGIADNNDALALVAGAGVAVLLTQDHDVVWQRIVTGGIPAFLRTQDPAKARARFAELAGARETRYRAVAHLVVAAADNPAGTAHRIRSRLEEWNRARK